MEHLSSSTNEEASGKKRVVKKPEATSNIENQIYFSIIPEWVIDCDIPAQAKVLYCVLQRYADKKTGECFPSISTLAKRMRVSDSTVKRQIKILIDIKALSKVARYDKETGEQTSNLYTVIQVPPFINDLPPSSSTTYKPKSSNQSQDIAKQIYAELTRAIGRKPVTKHDRGGWNKVVKDLKEANVDPRDIEAVVEAYRIYFKGMFITPHAISKHWGLLKQLIEENKPAEKYDCSKNGHRLRDLDVIMNCDFCSYEESK